MIHKLREAHGLTQKELGNKIGKSENYIKEMEEDFVNANPTLSIIEKLALTFDMCPRKLFCDICKTYIKPECNQDNSHCK